MNPNNGWMVEQSDIEELKSFIDLKPWQVDRLGYWLDHIKQFTREERMRAVDVEWKVEPQGGGAWGIRSTQGDVIADDMPFGAYADYIVFLHNRHVAMQRENKRAFMEAAKLENREAFQQELEKDRDLDRRFARASESPSCKHFVNDVQSPCPPRCPYQCWPEHMFRITFWRGRYKLKKEFRTNTLKEESAAIKEEKDWWRKQLKEDPNA